MDLVIYSAHRFEKEFLEESNAGKHHLKFLDIQLNVNTAYLAKDAQTVSIFVTHDASTELLEVLKQLSVKFLVLSSVHPVATISMD